MGLRAPGSTRERLLDVALDVIGEVGFDGATITEVERRAGLTPGTGSFYRHFRSKEELLRAAVEREVERCLAEVAAARLAAPQHDDPVEQEASELGLLLADIRRFARLFRLQLAEGDRVPGLRETIRAALEGPGGRATWADDPDLVLRIVALTGFHVLSGMPGTVVDGVPEDEFLHALAATRVRTAVDR
jgi:AcrR family transcriptional regulator